jgi:hypothetical protein
VGGSVAWAWRLIDRHRRREGVNQHQLEIAMQAIEKVTGR